MGKSAKKNRKKGLAGVMGGNRQIIHEPFTGAWQRNMELKREDISSFFAVFACVSKIAQDVSKLPLLTKVKLDGIWQGQEVKDYHFIKKPNHYQTLQQFFESWLNSKLFCGNAYIFKDRDVNGKIKGLYVLNSDRVLPLVDDDGEVYYQISNDQLNQLGSDSVVLPASEIIHDRWNCFYHSLVGLPPILACAISAGNGLVIQKNSSAFFGNQSRPAGILTAPGHLEKETAAALKERWDSAYSGINQGGTAVLGDGMAYQPIALSAADSQLIEQLRLSAEVVCSAFKMPPFLIGFGTLPAGMKVSDLNELYYSSCLQTVIEAIENLLTSEVVDEENIAIEFDLDSLIRMDGTSLMETLKLGISSALLTPDEGRARLGLAPVSGGDTPYLQQQNFSLAALAKRDAKDDPFSGKSNVPATPNEPEKMFQVAYMGIFDIQKTYKQGQFVTKNGSLWAVLHDHTGAFDHGNFKLCAKEWV